jgi:hypothetical protein
MSSLGVGLEGRAGAAPTSPVEYEQLITGIRELVNQLIPINATVAVVSRGDEVLLQLGRRKAIHFPRDEEGKWAGYYPADSDDAVRMVEEVREQGAEYFLLPRTGFWWLEYYQGLKAHLETRYRVVEAGADCWIVALSESTDLAAHSVPALSADTEFMSGSTTPLEAPAPLREVINGLLPEGARVSFLAVTREELHGAGAQDGAPAGLQRADYADSDAAIEHLRILQRNGVQFVVVRKPLFDWLDDQPEVREQLRKHRFVTRQDHLCEIYELLAPAAEPRPQRSVEESATEKPLSFGRRLRRLLSPSRRNGKRS